MSRNWCKANFPGVRYREHDSRKHNGRPDRYFCIRYSANYKDYEEGVGWASEGWNAEKVYKLLSRIKEGIKTGDGPKSLAQMRAESEARKEAEERAALLAECKGITLAEFLRNHYLPEAKRTKRTWTDDKSRIEKHILGQLGVYPLTAINRQHVRSFLEYLREQGLAEATVLQYFAILRRAYNLARLTIADGAPLFEGMSPVEGVPIPKPKNARERFLSYAEADQLVEAARDSGHEDLHAAIVIALNTGMRLGEILRLEWVDVNLEHGIVTIREEQSRKPGGKVFMNADAEAVFRDRYEAAQAACEESNGKVPGNRLVLAPPKGGRERSSLCHRFSDLVETLGYNEHVEDPRHKVVFHTLRHTFASWLALAGTDIYRIKSLMRHKTITMTMRYAHLIPDATRSAVNNLRPARAKSTVS